MFTKHLFVTSCSMLLCSAVYANNQDLAHWIQMKKQSSPHSIETSPAIHPATTYWYSAADRRSPFDTPNNVISEINLEDPCSHADCSQRPVAGRSKQMLEYVALSALSMVGTLERQHGEYHALIATPDGLIAHLKAGDYLGQNDGQITEITPSYVRIRELVKVGDSRWMLRQQVMQLRTR